MELSGLLSEGRRRAVVARLLEQYVTEDKDGDDAFVVLDVAASLKTSQIRITSRKKKRGGSHPGRSPNLLRDHAAGHNQLYADYFAANPVYPPSLFRRRFRISVAVFNHLLHGVMNADPLFTLRCDATGKPGLSPHQKVTASLRMLCYGIAADAADEYVRIAESTAMESVKRFSELVVELLGDKYLRHSPAADFHRHLTENAACGFPGMFGSLDCTHGCGKTGWQGMFQDRDGDRSVIMEAMATKNLWIWHSFVGMAGSNNDLNVVDRPPLIEYWLQGHAPAHESNLNGHNYTMIYLLCDGIYPAWSVFVKTIAEPRNAKEQLYAKKQEGLRKDVESCFGVLQGRFGILAQPGRI